MKNIPVLVITFLFSTLLIGCGMKGPLYQAPIAQPTTPAINQEKTNVEPQKTTEALKQDKNKDTSD